MVMPEMGFEVEPISPVRRDDTVTKNPPRMHDEQRAQHVHVQRGRDGDEGQQQQYADAHEFQRQVLVAAVGAGLAAARSGHIARNPCLMLPTMSGMERIRLIMPAVATAPAPI